MRCIRVALTALALLSFSGLSLAEGEFGGPNFGEIYLIPGVGFAASPDDLGLEDESVGPAGIIGFPMTDRFLAEVLIGSFDYDYSLPGAMGSDTANSVWVNGLFKYTEAKGPWQPFVLLGVGRTTYDFDDVREEVADNQMNFGLGTFASLGKRFALRADVRGVWSEESGGFEPFLFAGLSAVVGPVSQSAPTDTDGDGVSDRRDACPGTPPGRAVDAEGCELDSDGDGVVDGDDLCPNTPAGTEVDSRGCPDTDGDGVNDNDDDCPNTPAGVEVDRNGCALDSDGDGVPNYLDKCPNSEAGALVDETGCYVILEEDVTIDMSIEFDTSSADIRSSEIAEIRTAVQFLRQFPEAKAVIEGHSDSRGAEAFNQQLSERRAQSVYNYMINQAGIPAERLTYVGYGESRPISSNDTEEGRQRNRRVSAVLSATRATRATQ